MSTIDYTYTQPRCLYQKLFSF